MEETSGVADGLLSLPQGGGGRRGLGERFQPDPLRGTGSFGIPISGPRGPNELRPSLSLRYSTGTGNGPLGIGWRIAGPMEVRRRTDRGVPRYDEGDEFVLSGAETLVAVGGGRYRPRSDTQFWDIRRDGDGWTVRGKDGRRHTLGTKADSRIADESGRVLAWLEDAETDAAGNAITYAWDHDDAQAYLAEVAWSIYSLRLVWQDRPDPVYDGRGGFPLMTRRRLASIERRCNRLAQPLLARYDLTYAQGAGTRLSLLTEVRQTGVDETGTTEAYPPVRVSYSDFQPRRARYVRIGAEATGPPPLDTPGTALVDMDGDGLPDVLATDDGGHRWWPNRGDGSFGPPRRIDQVPAGMVLGRGGVTFADLRGDGAADLVRIDARLTVAVENTAHGSWSRPTVVRQQPALRLSATDTRVVDLDGDGVGDILQSTPDGYLLTYADGAAGWTRPQPVARRGDPAQFPDVALDTPGVELADMTGDGLADLVFVASGRVDYWPHHGRGRWGARMRMADAPVLPHGFNRDRLHLTDVDGDGLADLLYIDQDRILIWLNQSGVAWSEAQVIPCVPPPGPHTVELCDFLGTGMRGVLWTTLDRRGGSTGYRYLDIGAAGKPYLMTRVDSGLGGVTDITYTTSGALRTADSRAGTPWSGYLPFPVQVVSAIVFTDVLTGRTTTTRMRYREGVYDGMEREFRGFAHVEVQSDAAAGMPTTVQVTDFFVGDLRGPVDAMELPAAERARQRALSGGPTSVTTYEVAGDGTRTPLQSAAITWDARQEFAAGGRFVHFPRMVRVEARDHAPGDPDRIDVAEYDHDAYGNLTRKRRGSRFDGEPDAAALVSEQRLGYTANDATWLVGLPATVTLRDGAGRVMSSIRHHYDGDPHTGLPEGQATKGLLMRTVELSLADALLPDGYAAEIDPAWGLVHEADGWYRTSASYARDPRGNIVVERDGLGAEKQTTYDSDGLFPVRRVDALGLATEAAFDERTGQPLEMRRPDGTATAYRYSPIGRLQGQYETAPDGSRQLTSVFLVDYGDYSAAPPRPSRAASLRVLEPGHSLAELLGTADLSALHGVDVACDYYDADGNLLQRLRRAPDGNEPAKRWIAKQRRDWAAPGRPAADRPNVYVATPDYHAGLPADPAVRFAYNGTGRLTRVDQPDGGRIAFHYGTSAMRRWMPHMADTDPPFVEVHDAWGRIVAMHEPDGTGGTMVTRYTHDASDRPLRITDSGGRESVTYIFAGPQSAIRIVHADAGVRTYWYDAAGRLRQRTDTLGRRLRLDYDAEGRMLRAIDAGDPANPVTVRTLTYAGPRLTAATDGPVTETFEYDAAGRLSASTCDAGGRPLAVRREYGLQGELRALTYPDGTRLTQRYDGSLALRGIDGVVDGIDYDEHGAPVRISFTGGAFTTYEHEPLMRRLRTTTLQGGGQTVRRVDLDHDTAGRVVTWRDTLPSGALSRRFAYDGANRLVRAEMHQGDLSGALVRDDHYAYSASGDLLRNDESLIGAMVYGDAARTGLLTQVHPEGGAAVALAYDAGGRTTDLGGAHALRYDVWDRLVSATLPDGSEVGFAYDHAGRRVRRTVHRAGGDEITDYAENLFERGPRSTRLNVYADRLLVAVRVTPHGGVDTTMCVLTDHLGSVLAGCAPDGAVLHQQVYSPYGRTLQARSESDAYTGVRSDPELGLLQMGVRQYAPQLGRFITPDWWVIENPTKALVVPQSLNAYQYAVDNPLSFRDPTGMWFGIDDLVVAAVGFVVGFVAGTIYGLATGQGWNSLLIGLEAGLCGAAGAWLAWNTAGLALGLLGISGTSGVGMGIMIGAAVVGGFNGVVSGATQIYDWSSPVGWLSFISDSSWGLIGTFLGDLLIIVNLFYGSGAKYRDDLSRRQNRHVYDGGFGFGSFAFTQGNVTSNLRGRGTTDLLDHETLHIWQNRIFGPIFTITYAAWFVVGGVVGLVLSPFAHQSVGQSMEDVAYNDNPWESWAYDVGGSPTCGNLCWD